jgi:cytochrome c-type biogenesis protein
MAAMSSKNRSRDPATVGPEVRVPVYGVTCDGCAGAVRLGVAGLDGVLEVDVDLERHEVSVVGHGIDPATVRDRIVALGFGSPTAQQQQRRRWRPVVGLALAVSLVGGIVVFQQADANDLAAASVMELTDTFGQFSVGAVALAFALGLLVAFAPSSLAIAPAVMGYVSRKDVSSRRSVALSLAFIAGVVLVDAVVGALFAVGGAALMRGFTARLPLWYAVITVMLLALGLANLKVWEPKLPSYVPRLRKAEGMGGAFLLGIPFGLMACPSCTPLLLPVALGVAATGDPFLGATMMGLFALGRGLPLVVIGGFTGASRRSQLLSRWLPGIERFIGGVLLVAAAWFAGLALDAAGVGVWP